MQSGDVVEAFKEGHKEKEILKTLVLRELLAENPDLASGAVRVYDTSKNVLELRCISSTAKNKRERGQDYTGECKLQYRFTHVPGTTTWKLGVVHKAHTCDLTADRKRSVRATTIAAFEIPVLEHYVPTNTGGKKKAHAAVSLMKSCAKMTTGVAPLATYSICKKRLRTLNHSNRSEHVISFQHLPSKLEHMRANDPEGTYLMFTEVMDKAACESLGLGVYQDFGEVGESGSRLRRYWHSKDC